MNGQLGIPVAIKQKTMCVARTRNASRDTDANAAVATEVTLITPMDAKIPDAKTGKDRVDAVVIDDESVGKINEPGCGGKILGGDGALERYLAEANFKDRVEGNGAAEAELQEAVIFSAYIEDS
ncbi:UNVERIFIED_CONTAM: CLP protease regulatory subunit CLPX3, mitochondrial [Sesamum calycinum]|uniref:CLP protease regulatory subunit CLPX3, mitochondrial n=1 Tax=Sesamum calycinum TaxID=2727403 RepID=A0AAW2KA63_9LAMI